LLVLDLVELGKYFTFILNMKENRENSTMTHKARMRYCTHDDFEHRQVKVDSHFEKIIEKRLCPDILENETMFKVRNVYNNR